MRPSPKDVNERLLREWYKNHPESPPLPPDAGPFDEVLPRRAPWMFTEYGFKFLEADYSYRHFGDSTAYLRSDRLRIRFLRDRGQVFVELGSRSEPRAWYNLLTLFRAIHGHENDLTYDLEPLLQILRDDLPALIEALGPELEKTKRALHHARSAT